MLIFPPQSCFSQTKIYLGLERTDKGGKEKRITLLDYYYLASFRPTEIWVEQPEPHLSWAGPTQSGGVMGIQAADSSALGMSVSIFLPVLLC